MWKQARRPWKAAAALAGPGEGAVVDVALLRFAGGEGDEAAAHAPPGTGASPGTLDAAIADLERRMLRDALEATGGNQSEAARRLGVSRVGLVKKLARLGLR